jgi:hypothetical protein
LFVRVLVASTRRRSGVGLLVGASAWLLWALLLAAGWIGRGADAQGAVMTMIFVGPSAVPGATSRVPASAILAAHPVAAKVALGGVLLGGFAAAWRSARALSPLSDESSARKKLGLAFLMPALLVLAQAVCLALTELLAQRVGR